MANALASKGETIWPDELLGSGTVGTGSGAEHGKQLHQGDVERSCLRGVYANVVQLASRWMRLLESNSAWSLRRVLLILV